MKWKTAFTADEASMIAADIEWFYKLSSDSQAAVLGEDFDSIHEWLEAEPLPHEERVEIEKIKQQIENKEAIHQALLDEISFSDSCSEMDETASSPLNISVREQRGSDDNRIDVEKSKVTGDSLAVWFWKIDREIAAKFDGNIDRKMEPLLSGNGGEVLPGKKTVNSYLRLIYALSKALADGSLTGIKNKDAEIVLSALASKGVDCPISKRCLSEYLGEAKEH